jgi:hypothetical protein
MSFLIAVTGFSGAEKTTVINYLGDIGAGEKLYLGQAEDNPCQIELLMFAVKGCEVIPNDQSIRRHEGVMRRIVGGVPRIALG